MTLLKANVFFAFIQETPAQEVFVPGSVTLLAGKPKIGKTTIALALAKAFVTGQDFGKIKLRKSAVAYLAYEETASEIRKLIAPYMNQIKDLPFFLATNPDKLEQEILFQDIAREAFYDTPGNLGRVIIIDCLSAALGSKALRDTASVRKLFEPLHIAAQQHNIAIIVLHHLSKHGNNVADHVQLQGAATQVITMQCDTEAQPRTITWNCRGRINHGIQTFTFRSHNPWHFTNGKAREKTTTSNTTAILDCLESGAKTATEIQQCIGGSRRTIFNILSKLVSSGRVQRSTRKRYRLVKEITSKLFDSPEDAYKATSDCIEVESQFKRTLSGKLILDRTEF